MCAIHFNSRPHKLLSNVDHTIREVDRRVIVIQENNEQNLLS